MTSCHKKGRQFGKATPHIASREGWLSQPELIAGGAEPSQGSAVQIASREGWLSQPELIAGGAEPSQGSELQ
jgi:hypothetical protein